MQPNTQKGLRVKGNGMHKFLIAGELTNLLGAQTQVVSKGYLCVVIPYHATY